MNETNPYSTPQVSVDTNHVATEKLQGLDSAQIKKLYYRSCNVNAIAVILGLGFLILVIVSILPDARRGFAMRFGFGGLAVFYVVTIAGLFRRTAWGRILGIIACVTFLLNIPIGTAIGIFGLFAFIGAPNLFGSNRVTHRELKFEFKLQKEIPRGN